ncbi:MAG: EAL domain-containing protein [Bordetella sp.]|uniref:EAL domain-containing protein n=1 Tax=Bordetella sp. TaxID=28081 RepID=UPI003F7C6210
MPQDAGYGGLEIAASDQLLDMDQLYGSARASEMAALCDAIKAGLDDIVAEFYQQLGQLSTASMFIRCLSESERVHLKLQQGRNLLLLASPDLGAQAHRTVSMKVGRMHEIMGLPQRDLAYGLEILQAVIGRHIDAVIHRHALHILYARLSRYLTWQLEGGRAVRKGRQHALLALTQLAWDARGHADLISQAAVILGGLDGAVGCSFGRPDQQGIFRFESLSGDRIKGYLADLESRQSTVIMLGELPQGRGPTGRAWESGQIERCINIETDERMEPWRDIGRRHGIRSSLAVPLCPPDRTPTTILTLYSEFPGAHAAPEHESFITQVQALLTFAISRLEKGPGLMHALPWSKRQRWASLIGTASLEMHYQPIRMLNSGEVRRVEALVRLRDNDELLLPGMFFPALSREDFLLMYARGLEQVLAQQNRWLDQGLALQVAVNLPSQAIGDDRYLEVTRRLLQEYGPRPYRLALEVLETEDFPSNVCAAEILESFRALKIVLAEDDLGSGHSSLARLRTVPFDVVKIDRSILQGLEHGPIDTLGTVYQLTELCHALGKLVVVEGVEHEDLIEALALLGVDAAQGYAIARPMTAPALAEWMAAHRVCRPADPPSQASLVMLARLLLWESHLRLLINRPQSLIYQVTPEMRPVLPFPSVDAALQLAMLDAAVHHGMNGGHYAQARQNLIAAIGARR